MLASALRLPINHLLRAAPWALATLKPFAGKRFRIELPGLSLSFAIAADGQLESAGPNDVEDVRLKLSLGLLTRILADDRSAWREVSADGEAEFAQALAQVAQNLNWEAEEDLSRLVGDVLAHRIAGGARTLGRWQHQAVSNFTLALQEYFTEEQPLIAKRRDVENFVRQVDELRDAIARVEQRVERLYASRSGG